MDRHCSSFRFWAEHGGEGAEPELDESVLEPAQVEGGDLAISPQLLYGDVILMAAQAGADLGLEACSVGTERDTAQLTDGPPGTTRNRPVVPGSCSRLDDSR